MRLLFVMISVLSYTKLSLAEINMKDASLQKTFIDFKEIKRVYNSRSLKNDILGFGWSLHLELDKSQFLISYNKYGLIEYIRSHDGYYLKLSYNKDDRLIQIMSSDGKSVHYDYDGESLVRVKNTRNEIEHYKYDDVQNLIQIKFPDGKQENFIYESDLDQITSYQLKNGCVENFTYILNPQEAYQQSIAERTCNNKRVSQWKHEFWYKKRADGARVLDRHKISSEKQSVDMTYNPYNGGPVRILKNGKELKI